MILEVQIRSSTVFHHNVYQGRRLCTCRVHCKQHTLRQSTVSHANACMCLHVHMFSCFYRQEEELRFQKQKLENSWAELQAEKERSAD